MLRMHLSANDLARTRVAATWGPWAETVLCFGARAARPQGSGTVSALATGRESVVDGRWQSWPGTLGGRLLDRTG